MILADFEGSVLAPYIATGRMIEAGSWAVEGIGEDFVPPNADLSLVSNAFTIPDAETLATARELLRMEGVLAGSSSGTLLAAALRYCRAQSAPQRVVSLVCELRRQISVEGVQSHLPGAGGLESSPSPRHRARCRGQPLQ